MNDESQNAALRRAMCGSREVRTELVVAESTLVTEVILERMKGGTNASTHLCCQCPDLLYADLALHG